MIDSSISSSSSSSSSNTTSNDSQKSITSADDNSLMDLPSGVGVGSTSTVASTPDQDGLFHQTPPPLGLRNNSSGLGRSIMDMSSLGQGNSTFSGSISQNTLHSQDSFYRRFGIINNTSRSPGRSPQTGVQAYEEALAFIQGEGIQETLNISTGAPDEEEVMNLSQIVESGRDVLNTMTPPQGTNLENSSGSGRGPADWLTVHMHDPNRKSFSSEAKNAHIDHIFKILLIGDFGVGKSSLILRFTENVFTDGDIGTKGLDLRVRTVKLNGKVIKLRIWDTAGQERFRTIPKSYYKDAHGIMVVFDSTNSKSFINLNHWLKEINRYAPKYVNKIIVGNKCDLTSKQDVYDETAKKFADNLGIPFWKTSPKNPKTVEEAFLILALKIQERVGDTDPTSVNDKIKLARRSKPNWGTNSSCF